MSIAVAQQTNYVYTPRATFTWSSRNLNYIIISYYGNTTATATSVVSSKLSGASYTTGDLSLNTLYTVTLTPYNSAGGAGNSKVIYVDTSPAISVANIVFSSGSIVTFQWSGTYSYVKVLGKLSTDASYSDLSTNITTATYSYDGIDGNTDYTFYITPYSTGGVAGTSSTTMSVKTGVQGAKNLATSFVDNSAITVTFTAPSNKSNSTYYTFHIDDYTYNTTFDVSGTSSPLQVSNLSGNTSYSMYVITTINNDSTLASATSIITATTAVQPPVSPYATAYDSSAVWISSSDGRNTYSTIYYVAYAADTGGTLFSASGTTVPIAVSGLSGNTSYTLRVKNVLDGNTALSATSITAGSVTTAVQPADTLTGNVFVDGSAIGITFSGAKNTYTTRAFKIAASDICGASVASLSGAQAGATNLISGLSGNTQYFFTVSTTLNGNTALSATSTQLSARTCVQAPTNVAIPFYDSSAIKLSYDLPANSYTTSYYYDAVVTDGIATKDVSGTGNLLEFRDLSSNTNYTFYVRTYVTSRSSNTISFTTANRAYIPDTVFVVTTYH